MALQEKLGRFKQQQEKCQSMLSNIAAKSASSRSTPKPAPAAASPFSLLSACTVLLLHFHEYSWQTLSMQAAKQDLVCNVFLEQLLELMFDH
ncbi:hypothetical protein CXB51_012656 [Gossypium anomalum]|uniref:Uncharacterized protein n=1 Tax=Gossypium anomalum TaxID=47600 RepID=A0A8J5Z0Q2_9ROSI|nr:hypothetical protein CXB51_012656 [Gossypium anomalum]